MKKTKKPVVWSYENLWDILFAINLYFVKSWIEGHTFPPRTFPFLSFQQTIHIANFNAGFDLFTYFNSKSYSFQAHRK